MLIMIICVIGRLISMCKIIVITQCTRDETLYTFHVIDGFKMHIYIAHNVQCTKLIPPAQLEIE